MFRKILKLLIIKPYRLLEIKQQLLEMQKLLDISTAQLIRYLTAVFSDIKFHNYMNKKIKIAHIMCQDSNLGGWIDILNSCFLYIVIRHVKPAIVIETGVGPGGSSSFILKALDDNKKGILYSIDLPGNDALVYPKLGKNFNIHTPQGWKVGWLIPEWFKYRHKLIIGDSSTELPRLLNKINSKIDIFLHDSLHTDEHILMEFKAILPFLNDRSILLCDDVTEYWSLAFIKFCEKEKIPFIVANNRLGIAKYEK